MQSVMDSLCRCFGTTPLNGNMGAMSNDMESIQDNTSIHATGKRRTRSLALNDKQWDTLFTAAGCGVGGGGGTSSPAMTGSVEQAQAVAKAKLAAKAANTAVTNKQSKHNNNHNNSSKTNNNPRLKRKRSCSRDAIFRSKKNENYPRNGGAATNNNNSSHSQSQQPNPFSRFLSNHPVIAQTLCFATPVHDPEETPPDDNNSVVSDTNTLNTAGDDTITSTLYYETTKLAGLQQTSPPMPLFNNFAVDERDDIHQIVATHSHSTNKWMDYNNFYPNPQRMNPQPRVVQPDPRQYVRHAPPDPRVNRMQYSAPPPQQQQRPSSMSAPPVTPVRADQDDSVPPPMTHSSSGSSRNSGHVSNTSR